MTGWKIVAGVSLLMTGCASYQSPQEHQAELRTRYTPYLQAPVARFELIRPLDSWEVLGPYELVVRTEPHTAYWLSLDKPCPNLEWVQNIALTSPTGWVSAHFDAVTTSESRCRIREIRPIDMVSLRKAESG